MASARHRDLRSGLVQVIATVIVRLSQTGVLHRPDAFEYLASAREAWTAPVADPQNGEAEGATKVEEEPLDQLVERLDAMVLGLIEALDADADDLPKLLDEALKGSLWARQLQDGTAKTQQLAVLRARANLIWTTSSPTSRRGHFAMGVGLDAGLAIDAMADELGALLDEGDLAALRGDPEDLAAALAALAERVFAVRPFKPDTTLPANWRDILKAWISGTDVAAIGVGHMRVVEEAFAYRLVWALEALRTRRMTLGWSPEFVAGGGAAALETGVPALNVAMLIRAGLPSRRAAMAAISQGGGEFFDLAGMRAWIESPEIEVHSATGVWPTPETAALWLRFRSEAIGAATPQWRKRTDDRDADISGGAQLPPAGDYRLEIEAATGDAWLTTADFTRVARLRRSLADRSGALYRISVGTDDASVRVERLGPASPKWGP